jgi:hypothetical protein
MTAKEYFKENLSGEPLTEESVIEGLEEYARIYVQKYLNPQKVNRVEVINHSSNTDYCGIGRVFSHYEVNSCELAFQDGMKTLKIFI